jgi:hypothetical protein
VREKNGKRISHRKHRKKIEKSIRAFRAFRERKKQKKSLFSKNNSIFIAYFHQKIKICP